MSFDNACSSFEWGKQICKDGFPISAICMGQYQCFTCGAVSKRLPACQREDLDKRWLDDSGKPKLFRAQGESK